MLSSLPPPKASPKAGLFAYSRDSLTQPSYLSQGMSPPRRLGLNVIARSYEFYKSADSGLITTTRKIKEKRDEVKRIIIAGIKASRYIRANRDATVQSLMELFRTDREMAGANYEYLSKTLNDNGSPTENGFRLLIEDIKESVKVSRAVSFNEVSDLSILREAQRELGIK